MAQSGAERVRKHRDRLKGLEAAKVLGRRYGVHEADRQGLPEDSVERRERIERAVGYAVWDYEGRPVTGVPLKWPSELGVVS